MKPSNEARESRALGLLSGAIVILGLLGWDRDRIVAEVDRIIKGIR